VVEVAQAGATLRRLGGGTAYLGEDPGLASLYDVAVLSLMWSVLNGFLHGAALLGKVGVDATRFAPIAEHSIRTIAERFRTGSPRDAGRVP